MVVFVVGDVVETVSSLSGYWTLEVAVVDFVCGAGERKVCIGVTASKAHTAALKTFPENGVERAVRSLYLFLLSITSIILYEQRGPFGGSIHKW